MQTIKPAQFLAGDNATFRYLEKSSPHTSGLQFLTYGVYELAPGAASGTLAHPEEEALLFCWKGTVSAHLNDATYSLEPYDVLYVPRGAAYRLAHASEPSK